MNEFVKMRVGAIRRLAGTVSAIALERLSDAVLPSFAPGAHVDLRLPGGLVRSYSLYTLRDTERRYEIAVNRDGNSRGGSAYLHERLRVGDVLEVSAPRNHFPLIDGDHPTLLIAGGIGITPLYCMAQQLAARGARWHMVYAARSRAGAAFVDELQALADAAGMPLTLHFDDEAGGRLDIPAIVAHAPPDTHFYCCGPAPMLDAYLSACSRLPAERVHYERFGADIPMPGAGQGFDVELARSGRTLRVRPDQTILEVLLDAGVDVEYSCMQGVCGSCRTGVLAGEPEHLDMFLSPEEQAASDCMMICCSRARGARLVLDC
ncbi:PDR/VanB family oxidoreductase [Bordetella genomosp. 13]|nr:PDR/VanB family oxidoreductase [Bordetella genomosp. 13]